MMFPIRVGAWKLQPKSFLGERRLSTGTCKISKTMVIGTNAFVHFLGVMILQIPNNQLISNTNICSIASGTKGWVFREIASEMD